MASEKEGIALLSMYDDDDDDDGAEEEHPDPPPPPPPPETEEDVPVTDEQHGAGGATEPLFTPPPEYATPSASRSMSPAFLDGELEYRTLRSPTSPSPSPLQVSSSLTPMSYSFPARSPTPPPLALAHGAVTKSLEVGIVSGSSLTIVDYGHDDVAMSPEHDGGVLPCGRLVVVDSEIQVVQVSEAILKNETSPKDMQVSSPITQQAQPSNISHQFNMESFLAMPSTGAVPETDHVEQAIGVVAGVQGVDPLINFLKPPPATKCSEQLQEKINKYLAYKRAGKSFNADLRSKKDYRNPDFLQHAVQYQSIDQIGTYFSKDVFDPYGYDKSDYYNELEASIERKEQERKKGQKIDFLSGGTQVGAAAAALKISSHIAAGLPAAPTSVLQMNPAVECLGRQNKKSKWDKVDGDAKNPLHAGGQDNLSATGINAAHMSTANAGAGYTAFAQQKRREAEEKKSSEKRAEKRS